MEFPEQPDNRSNSLDTSHLRADLKGRSIRGTAVTLIAQLYKLLLQFGSTFILARLLSPDDFGLIAMVIVFTALMDMLKDFGLVQATIQREHLTQEQVSTLFWINTAFSIIVMLVTVAMAPAISWFYDQPLLTGITMALAAVFVFNGLATQHKALLSRQMRFVALGVVDLVPATCGAVIAIITAWNGAGYWALVYGQLSAAGSRTLLLWAISGWFPGRPVRGAGVRSMLRFGGNLAGFSIVAYLTRSVDVLLLGRFYSEQMVGLYDQAFKLSMRPLSQALSPVSTVAVPALSRLMGEPHRYRAAYLRALEKIALFFMPLAAFAILYADQIVLLVLGSKFSGSIPIFAVLSFLLLITPIAGSTTWLYISQGRSRDLLLWGLGTGLFRVVAVAVGLRWGPVGVAVGYTVSIYILMPFLFAWTGRTGPIQPRDFYNTIAPFLGMTAIIALIIWGARILMGIQTPVYGLMVGVLVTTAASLGTAWSIPRTRRALLDTADWVRMLIMDRRNGGDQTAIN